MPTRLQHPVDQPEVAAEELRRRPASPRRPTGGVGHQHRDPEERPAAQPVVEQVREAERHAQLRDGGDDADGERVAQRVPEELVCAAGCGSCSRPTQAAPGRRSTGSYLVQRDPGRVEQREEAERARRRGRTARRRRSPAVAGQPAPSAGPVLGRAAGAAAGVGDCGRPADSWLAIVMRCLGCSALPGHGGLGGTAGVPEDRCLGTAAGRWRAAGAGAQPLIACVRRCRARRRTPRPGSVPLVSTLVSAVVNACWICVS